MGWDGLDRMSLFGKMKRRRGGYIKKYNYVFGEEGEEI